MSNISSKDGKYHPNNPNGVFPILWEYLTNNQCLTLCEACKATGVNYNVLTVMTKAVDRAPLKALLIKKKTTDLVGLPPKETIIKTPKVMNQTKYTHFDYSMVDRVEKILLTGNFTFKEAIAQVGISDQTFYNHVSKEVRLKLKELGASKCNRFHSSIITQNEPIVQDSLNEDKEMVYDYKSTESSLTLSDLPQCMYKHWSEPTIGRMVNIQCRLFFRVQYVEKEIYFVAGYEYQTHPGIYQPDQFLQVYSLESISNVIQKLYDKVSELLIKTINEPELGEVKYTRIKQTENFRLNPASNSISVEYDYRKLKAKTPVKLNNGEYNCDIISNQGIITDVEGTKHTFILDEKVPMKQTNIKCKVIQGSVTVYL